jgi:pyruvate dehydrogenase E1 component alpha subunit
MPDRRDHPKDIDRPLALFHDMLRIRMVEEAIADRYAAQEMRCPVHLSIGQEAAAVGICAALRRDDRVFSTHRCHAHYLAKGGALDAMLAEIHGKATGCIGGRGGSMHLQDPDAGLIASVPIVGGSIPLAVGTALADSLDGNDRVSVCFFGDATVEEGVFHESANFAALRRLPVLFVCENNLYSVYTPLHERQPDRPIERLAEAHDVAAFHVDGNDIAAVAKAGEQAVASARAGRGPSFLLLDTYRWREHCGPAFDNHIGYRTEAEYQEWHARDPLARARASLVEAGVDMTTLEAEMAARIAAEIDASFAAALAAPLPVPADAWEHVYA